MSWRSIVIAFRSLPDKIDLPKLTLLLLVAIILYDFCVQQDPILLLLRQNLNVRLILCVSVRDVSASFPAISSPLPFQRNATAHHNYAYLSLSSAKKWRWWCLRSARAPYKNPCPDRTNHYSGAHKLLLVAASWEDSGPTAASYWGGGVGGVAGGMCRGRQCG
jgi:hypothetical protein